MKENSDAQLVARARAGDTYAFQLLIERYQVMALYLAQHYVDETETARELVQEAFLQAYLSLDHLRDATRFKNWLYGIILNICRNWRRLHPDKTLSLEAQATRSEHVEHTLHSADPQELAEEHELQQVLRAAINALTPRNQAVAYLFYYEDMSVQEIAYRLNIAQTTVKNRLHKGRQQLQARLQIDYPEIARPPIGKIGKRKKKTMLTLKFIKLLHNKQFPQNYTAVILLDEQKQRIWLQHISEYNPTDNQEFLTAENTVVSEPTAIDFLIDMIHSLQGTVEEVAIETLYGDLLYARVRLSGQRGQHTIKAHLRDALSLAVRTHSPIMVAEEILDRQAINLAGYGETQQQQLATIEALAEQDPYRLQHLQQKPSNLDFSDGLNGWSLFTSPQQATYSLDPSHTRTGKASLALTLQQEATPNIVLLSYKSFSARPYHGQRLRARAYLKADNMQQPIFNMSISGSFPGIDMPEEHKQHVRLHADTSLLYIADSGSWTAHEVVMDIPTTADTVRFAFTMRGQGKGTIWLDGIQLETVDKSTPLTGTQIDPVPRRPLNLDFSHGLEFWHVQSATPWQYERDIDHSSSPHAAYIKAIVSAPDSLCTLQQMVSTELYGGRSVRFSASVKTDSAETHGSLFLAQFIGSTRIAENIKGTTGWTRYELTLAVPEGSFGLCFGITLHGSGQLWLKEPQLQIENDVHG